MQRYRCLWRTAPFARLSAKLPQTLCRTKTINTSNSRLAKLPSLAQTSVTFRSTQPVLAAQCSSPRFGVFQVKLPKGLLLWRKSLYRCLVHRHRYLALSAFSVRDPAARIINNSPSPKGGSEKGIQPKHIQTFTFKPLLSHLNVTFFPDPPFRIPLLGTVKKHNSIRPLLKVPGLREDLAAGAGLGCVPAVTFTGFRTGSGETGFSQTGRKSSTCCNICYIL